MRLFNRKKEMEFDDDAKLVGMAPLSTTDDNNFSANKSHKEFPETVHDNVNVHQEPSTHNTSESEQKPNHVKEKGSSSSGSISRNSTLLLRDSSQNNTSASTTTTSTSRIDNNKSSNGGLSTWSRKVGKTWESLLRSESSEKLNNCSTLSSASNRRKTLHFYPENGEKSEFPEIEPKAPSRRRSGSISSGSLGLNGLNVSSSDTESLSSFKHHEVTRTPSSVSNLTSLTAPRRKIGRVESLRNLLSKRNYRGRSKSSGEKGSKDCKVSVGTDTQDLDGENAFDYDEDGVFTSNLNLNENISTPKRRVSIFGFGNTLSRKSSEINLNRNLTPPILPKSTSCENLSTVNYHYHTINHVSTSTDCPTMINSNSSSINISTSTMSTSTFNSTSSLSSSIPSNYNSIGKKSSFPYAYIRSKLTSLPEEPSGNSSTKRPPTPPPSEPCSDIPHQKSTRMTIRGFYHSMGNLLGSSGIESDDEDIDDEIEALKQEKSIIEVSGSGSASPAGSAEEFNLNHRRDPLAQIRIDLLHKNPSEIDDERSTSRTGHESTDTDSGENCKNNSPNSPNSYIWGRRSFSIGDMLHSPKDMMIEDVEKLESGYDSDSTRNGGHESPRNSLKLPSTEGETSSNCSENLGNSSSGSSGSPSSNSDSGSGSYDEFRESPEVRIIDSNEQSNYFFNLQNPNQNNGSNSSTSTIIRKSKSGKTCIDLRNSPGPPDYHLSLEIKSQNHNQNQSEDKDSISQNLTSICTTIPESHTKVQVVENAQNFDSNAKNTNPTTTTTISISKISKSKIPKIVDVQEKNKNSSIPVSNSNCEKTHVKISSDTSSTSSSNTNNTSIVQKITSSAPSLKLRNKVRDRDQNLSRSSRAKSLCLSIFTVQFEKGPDKKSLGFSVVGGIDSPRGNMGIYIRRILPYGQAAESDLIEGDEVLSINGISLSAVTHSEALQIFKDIKSGTILLNIARREITRPKMSRLFPSHNQFDPKSISCENLDKTL